MRRKCKGKGYGMTNPAKKKASKLTSYKGKKKGKLA